jgi:hypothetical protein
MTTIRRSQPAWDPTPTTSRLVRMSRAAAEAESVEARALVWRDRGDAERSAALAGLMNLSDAIVRGRGRPHIKPPLTFPHFSSARPTEVSADAAADASD